MTTYKDTNMTKTKEELFARLEASDFDFYLDDDSLIDEDSLEADELTFIEAEAVTVRSEWFDTPVEGEELASVDDEGAVWDFLNSLKSEGYSFRVEEKEWANEDGGYSVYALLVVP